MEILSKLKVMTVVGTRPEIIRLSRVINKLEEYVNHVLVATGQSYDYEMYDIFLKELELKKPDYFLGIKSETLGGQIANLFLKGEEVLKKENPDALLILGDTNSSLISILAKRFKIPIFHMEAGNRCFDENVPEEINRKIIDHISDINLPYTEHSRRYLIQEGIHSSKIVVTGSPLSEVADYFKNKINNSQVLKNLNLTQRDYFLLSTHREENVTNEKKFKSLLKTFNSLAERYKKPIIVTTHPRTRKILDKINFQLNPLISFCKPFGYFDYMFLQKNALCVLSDSGTIQEESAILGFPSVQIRTSSERPEAFDTGGFILAGVKENIILQAVDVAIDQFKKGEIFRKPQDYQDLNVSSKVLRLILGLAKIKK